MDREQTQAYLETLIERYLKNVEAGPGFNDPNYDKEETRADFIRFLVEIEPGTE